MLTALVLYLAAMLAYSLAMRRRACTEVGFYVSNRELNVSTVSLSLAATTIGGSAIVVTWTLIDRHGAWGILPDLGGALGLVFLGVWLAGKVRKKAVLTLPGLLSGHYPALLVRLLSLAIAVAQLAWLALSFKTLQMVTGIGDLPLVAVGVLTALYSYVGGQWSVSRTDMVQFAVLAAGFLLVLTGGIGSVAVPDELPTFHLVFITILMLCSHLVGPDIYAKVLSATSQDTARKGAWIAGLLKAGVAVLILLAHSTGLRLNELNLLLFLGIASAILSSVDSIFISCTAVIQKDVFRMKESRVTPYLIGAGLLVLSLLMALSGAGVVAILAAGYTVFLVALFYPTLSALNRDRGHWLLVVVPPLCWILTWWFSGPEAAFITAMIGGGVLYAVTGRNRA